jgi:RNA polymerase sigma-70 factor (ECF subfamily)
MAVRFASTDPHADLERGLRRFAQALGLDPDQTERALGGALRRARRAERDGLESEERLRAQAYGVLARVILDQAARAAPARPRLAPAPQAPGAPMRGASAVRAAAASLPPLERIALLLVAVEGLAYQDAAAALDVSRADFAAALARARAGLALRLRTPERDPARRPRLRLVR